MSIGKNTESNTHADNRRVVFTFFISLFSGHGHVPWWHYVGAKVHFYSDILCVFPIFYVILPLEIQWSKR